MRTVWWELTQVKYMNMNTSSAFCSIHRERRIHVQRKEYKEIIMRICSLQKEAFQGDLWTWIGLSSFSYSIVIFYQTSLIRHHETSNCIPALTCPWISFFPPVSQTNYTAFHKKYSIEESLASTVATSSLSFIYSACQFIIKRTGWHRLRAKKGSVFLVVSWEGDLPCVV